MNPKLEPYSESVTGSDVIKRFTPHDIFLDSGIIECQTYAMKYGAGPLVENTIGVGDKIPIGGVNLRELLIVNDTAGSNGVLKITGWVQVG